MWWFKKNTQPNSPEATEANDTSGPKVLSFLSPQEIEQLGGLPSEAIVGTFEPGKPMVVEHFRPNPKFVQLMHDVIRLVGPTDRSLQDAAKTQKDGWLYVIDLRTPDGPQGRVPPEDIVGAFQVRNGELVPGSYRANETHLVFSTHGLVRLPASFHRALIQASKALKFSA